MLSLRLAEQEIDGPASAHVHPGLATVIEDRRRLTPYVLKNVRQTRQLVEGRVVVDRLAESNNFLG